MKKILNNILVLLIAISFIVLLPFVSEKHCFHIHSDDISAGTCPNCGHELTIDFYKTPNGPTCTEGAIANCSCYNCGAVENLEVRIGPLGHDYDEEIKKATCTEEGRVEYICKRCGDSYTETIKALGHDYKYKVTKEATCLEEGEKVFECSRCKKTYTEKIKALGHDFEFEEKEPTCLEAGYKKGFCKNCGKEVNKVFPPEGHKPGEFKTIKEATCTEDGLKEATCTVCGETIKETIEKKGHQYPEEWTVVKEAGYFIDGEESKVCSLCGEKITQIIPHKDPTVLIEMGIGAAVALAAVVYVLFRKFGKENVEKAIEQEKEKIELEFENKTVLIAGKDEEVIEMLKARPYLKVVTCDFEELDESAEENEPDLIIIDILSDEALDEVLEKKKEALKDRTIGLCVIPEMLEENKERFEQLKKDKEILNYVPFGGEDKYAVLTRLILPIEKPDLKSDEALYAIGTIADLLGIPGVSTVINVYVSGRDIKSTIEEGELNVNSTATVISDIAYILGFDKVGKVVGLVNDVDSIKTALDPDAGMHEKKDGLGAAKDIVEVVHDIKH
ncbi:MAG: hypothetical protein IK151_01600 [Erysipelotrichaceae bacterium]|nr:hypothetical protein [Erysipelotrichaceae bacterium]